MCIPMGKNIPHRFYARLCVGILTYINPQDLLVMFNTNVGKNNHPRQRAEKMNISMPVQNVVPKMNKPVDRERRRQRLSAESRTEQILTAAQQEFIEKGYTATRMDDIALRSGLSKGGLYAHFESKDAVFEALMRRSLLAPEFSEFPGIQQEMKAHAVAEWLVDELHASLLQEKTIAMFRLLIAESERIPHVIEQWYREVVQAYMDKLQTILHNVTERLGCSGNVIANEPWLVFAPVMHAMVMQMLLKSTGICSAIDYRASHTALLTELLTPRQPINSIEGHHHGAVL